MREHRRISDEIGDCPAGVQIKPICRNRNAVGIRQPAFNCIGKNQISCTRARHIGRIFCRAPDIQRDARRSCDIDRFIERYFHTERISGVEEIVLRTRRAVKDNRADSRRSCINIESERGGRTCSCIACRVVKSPRVGNIHLLGEIGGRRISCRIAEDRKIACITREIT